MYQDTYSGFLLLLSMMSPSSASTEIRLGGVSSRSSLRGSLPYFLRKTSFSFLSAKLAAASCSLAAAEEFCGADHRVAGYGNVTKNLIEQSQTDTIICHPFWRDKEKYGYRKTWRLRVLRAARAGNLN